MTSLETLVRLNLSGMVGSALLRRLEERFGPRDLHRVSRRDLERVPGIGPLTSKAIAGAGDPAREIDLARRHGIEILACNAPGFPPVLRTLHDHPIVLYRRGTSVESDALSVGVVGSRACTDYGRRQAGRFAQELARLGVTVVSGLARGVDTAAHRGALRPPGGRTVAVLGSGLLRIYPPENARLLEEIVARGAVLSEFPLQAAPEPANFPRRNRLISGLSLGVLVVEAAERSGALLTADWALEQNREVFCMPGPVENPMSRGCHRLIKQGAKLAEDPLDVLEEIPAFAPLIQAPVRLSPLERAVLRRLTNEPQSAEAVAAGAVARWRFQLRLPQSAEPSRAYYLTEEREGELYRWPRERALWGESVNPDLFHGRLVFTIGDHGDVEVGRPGLYRGVDKASGEFVKPVQVVPALSLSLDPSLMVWPSDGRGAREFRVTLKTLGDRSLEGTVGLGVPEGWEVSPRSAPFSLSGSGGEADMGPTRPASSTIANRITNVALFAVMFTPFNSRVGA